VLLKGSHFTFISIACLSHRYLQWTMDAAGSTSKDTVMDGGRKRMRTEASGLQATLSSSPPSRQKSLRDSREPPPMPKRVACTHCRQSKVCGPVLQNCISQPNIGAVILGCNADIAAAEM
jgi:hypothetical protein